MKLFIVFAIIGVLHGALCAPVSVSDNNIGDIVVVGVNVNADIQTALETNIVNVLVGILQKLGDVSVGLPGGPPPPPGPPGPPPPPPPTTSRPEINPPTETEEPEIESPIAAAFQKLNGLKAIEDFAGLITQSGQTKEQKEQLIKDKIQEWIQLLKATKQ